MHPERMETPLEQRRRYHPMQDALRSFFGPWWSDLSNFDDATGSFPVDMHEEEDAFVVEAELPGFKREEIELSLEGDRLDISATRQSEKRPAGRRRVSERRFTQLERSLHLPGPVTEEEVEARLEDGVLYVKLPKEARGRQKRIQVK